MQQSWAQTSASAWRQGILPGVVGSGVQWCSEGHGLSASFLCDSICLGLLLCSRHGWSPRLEWDIWETKKGAGKEEKLYLLPLRLSPADLEVKGPASCPTQAGGRREWLHGVLGSCSLPLHCILSAGLRAPAVGSCWVECQVELGMVA